MATKKEIALAKLYNLKSVVQGMVPMVKADILTIDQALKGINVAVIDMNDELERLEPIDDN